MRERDIERHLVKRVKELGGEVREGHLFGTERDLDADRSAVEEESRALDARHAVSLCLHVHVELDGNGLARGLQGFADEGPPGLGGRLREAEVAGRGSWHHDNLADYRMGEGCQSPWSGMPAASRFESARSSGSGTGRVTSHTIVLRSTVPHR